MDALLIIGIAIIIGILGARLSTKLKLPSVVGWIIVGVLLGPSVFKLFKPEILDKFGIISDTALGLIAFIIGAELTIGTLKGLGGGIVSVIFAESFIAFILVTVGVWFLTHNLLIALILGALAPASAPAGTVAVLQEYKAKGPLTNAILTVVGADDALAIVIFAFALSYAKVLIGGAKLPVLVTIGKPLLEIIMAIGIGGAIGIVLGFLTQKVMAREILLPASIGAILVCAGLSKVLNFSLILSNLALGMVMVNTYPRACRRTHEALRLFVVPFYIIFFILAGAHLNLSLLLRMGIIGIIYIVCRTGGKLLGAWSGAKLGKQAPVIRKYLGLGILSQAGVAIGLAYLVIREFTPLGIAGQHIATLSITIIAATTIIFEILGPIGVKFAITRAGEVRGEK